MKLISMKELKKYKHKEYHVKIKVNIYTIKRSNRKNTKKKFFFESKIPVVLEVDTGTSKTKSIEVLCNILGKKWQMNNIKFKFWNKYRKFNGKINNENWSDFIDEYINGKILLLDEVNLLQKSIIQYIQFSLDSDEICVEIPGRKKKNQYYRNKDFMIICTQNSNRGGFKKRRFKRIFTKISNC